MGECMCMKPSSTLWMNCLSSRYLAAVNAKQVRTVVPPQRGMG